MKKMLRTHWFGLKPASCRKILGVLTLALAIAGCSRKAEHIVIRGSNTVGEELAPRLIAEYQKEHPGVTFDIEFKGTTYGLGALMVARCDIAAASRELITNDVVYAKDHDVALNEHIIGTYSVAVVVNARSPVGSLTKNEVRDIFSGAVDNWRAVGGPDAPIHLYIRDPISGTYLGFRELAMENKTYALHVKTATNYQQIVEAVAQDPNGIGYTSLQLTTKPGVRAVFIDGVPPTTALVNKGQYPYARVLRLFTSQGKETETALEFVKFVESPAGQRIMDEMGFVPKP